MGMKKIGIWGQFGDGGPIADGQAVRTTMTTEELIKKYGTSEVCTLNTNSWRKHPVKFFVETVRLVAKCENVIILPADNGLRIVVPIYNFFNLIYKRRLFYIVIGGFLPDFLKKYPHYVKMLNKYTALFVQTPNIKNDLCNLGVKHIEMITNFKLQEVRSVDSIKINKETCVNLCVLSRLTKDKGIEDAVEAVNKANAFLNGPKIHLDLYGIVPDSYKKEFDILIKENSDVIAYKGVVDYNKTAAVLAEYFALVFPTYFHGEGFAGCLIDAFFAGIPVIVTDWLYNKDVVEDSVNGFLVPIKNSDKLAEAMINLYNNRELALNMSLANVKKAEEFTADKVLQGLYNYLD